MNLNGYPARPMRGGTRAHLHALVRDGWVIQPKYDGMRCCVSWRLKGDTLHIEATSRKLKTVTLHTSTLQHLAVLLNSPMAPERGVLDGELVGQAYHVFDMPSLRHSLHERLEFLLDMFSTVSMPSPLVALTPVLDVNSVTLDELLSGRRVTAMDVEGVVAKDPSSTYHWGVHPDDETWTWLKFRHGQTP